jgi:hypothetical protein
MVLATYSQNPDEACQRSLGYFDLYDQVSFLGGLNIDCEPIEFNYGNKKWKIELWKDSYLFGDATGAEIGVYTNP